MKGKRLQISAIEIIIGLVILDIITKWHIIQVSQLSCYFYEAVRLSIPKYICSSCMRMANVNAIHFHKGQALPGKPRISKLKGAVGSC